MKSCVVLVFCALMVYSVVVPAQGVYVSPGENGPVFSDQPQPGARELTLRPLTVIAPPQDAGGAAPSAESAPAMPEAAAFLYRSFSVVSPENNGSVVANNAVFEVRVAVDPPLQLGDGHAFSVSLNGQPVRQRFTTAEFMIPPEFWGDTLPPPNQRVQLDASIVDFDGQVLKQAAPIQFFMRHATVLNHPRRRAPPFDGQRPPARPSPELEPAATMRNPNR